MSAADAERVFQTYRRGLITLGETVDMLAEIDRRDGPQPVTRSELIRARMAAGG